MEIEKTMTVAAAASQVWGMLLDPNVMGSCVPGMRSIEVISDTEYVAVIHTKISFISASFKLRTQIVEQRAPHYLRCEGTGEDTSVASSLRQQTELFLRGLPDGGTEIRMHVKVDVLGRLGTFGLGVMKTKADRMWDEFGRNLAARLEAGPGEAPVSVLADGEPFAAAGVATTAASASPAFPKAPAAPAVSFGPPDVGRGWFSRLFRRRGDRIRVELRRGDAVLSLDWPASAAADCAAVLRDFLALPER